MKFLKRLLFIVAALIALLLIVALFVKKEFETEREIVINKPKQIVFDYVKLLKNQNNFSKWASMDPAMKKDFRGTDGTVGFVSAWDSDKKGVGKGEQEITAIKEGERIDYELRFIKPFESKAKTYMTTEAINDSTTKVKWGFESKMAYPSNIMRLFVDMEKVVGDDFGTGLANLKTIMEKQ